VEKLVHLRPILTKHTYWSLGDGRQVDFCGDVWIDKGIRLVDMNIPIPDQWRHAKAFELAKDDGVGMICNHGYRIMCYRELLLYLHLPL
jgi:hypothetical protein